MQGNVTRDYAKVSREQRRYSYEPARAVRR